MSDFYVIKFKRKQRRRLLFVTVLSFCFILFVYYSSTYFATLQVKQTALIKGDDDEKNIALTFNISWGDEKVEDILHILKKYNVRATFFVSGEWAERHPQIVDHIIEQEHELGMLGYRYKNYLEQEIVQVRKDMIYAREIFTKLGYKDVRYIRPPSGLFNKEIISLAETIGLEVVHWSINSNDWENPGVDEIIAEVKKSSNGDIILFHASDVAKQTATALETIIPHYEKKGFTFLTISQLKDGVKSEEKIVE